MGKRIKVKLGRVLIWIAVPIRALSLAFFLTMAIGVPTLAQKSTKQPSPTPERSPSVVALLNDARLAAPELAIDTFLKVIESKKVADPAWRKEILEEALRMTDDVRYPMRKSLVYLTAAPVADTDAGYMTYAYDLQLDGLSLKARVIKNMLTNDKERAREMLFQTRGELNLKRLTCEDAMAYDVGQIYSTLTDVAKSSFTSKEINEGVRALFILPWIEDIESPAQIMPVIDLLSNLQSPQAERHLLLSALEKALARNFGDDRSFTHIFTQDLHKATRFINGLEDQSKISFTSAWREFLAKNSSGTRCLENKPKKKDDLPFPLEAYNFILADARKFAPADFESVEYKDSAKVKIYLNSPTWKKIDRKFRLARAAKNDDSRKDDIDAQLEWRLKVGELLEDLDSWKASDTETESEVFNQKSVFYRVISENVDGDLKADVLRAFLRYLTGSSMQKTSFIEWFYHVKWVAAKHGEIFRDLASEFPNPNLKVMLAVKRITSTPSNRLAEKVETKPVRNTIEEKP